MTSRSAAPDVPELPAGMSWWTPKALASRLDYSVRTIYDECIKAERGESSSFPNAWRLGKNREWRIPHSDVVALLS